jgi:putative hydrolase of the HAD superfamily
MKHEAVIFDLFGTLVDIPPIQEHKHVLSDMAGVLFVSAGDFENLWIDTFNERMTGIFASPRANIEHICQRVGVSPDDESIKSAARIRRDYTQRLLTPRADAIETLKKLRSEGRKIGLISDCSAEVPKLWADTRFAALIDEPVFSCSEGLRKPNSRIYQIAIDRLRVPAHNCLYVGDGSHHELTGASQAGMHPVLIRVPYEDNFDAYRISPGDWDGPMVTALKDILAMVE